jgi:hypothetical protein
MLETVVSRSFDIAGKAGRYISMENGLTVKSAPSIKMMKKCSLLVIYQI